MTHYHDWLFDFLTALAIVAAAIWIFTR